MLHRILDTILKLERSGNLDIFNTSKLRGVSHKYRYFQSNLSGGWAVAGYSSILKICLFHSHRQSDEKLGRWLRGKRCQVYRTPWRRDGLGAALGGKGAAEQEIWKRIGWERTNTRWQSCALRAKKS